MTNLSLTAIFSDHMIIQRDTAAAIWGQASPGAAVTIRFAGHEIQAGADDGHWHANLPAVAAGGPYELVIGSQDETIEIKDILAGEVWIAGGQSNMEWPLLFTADGKKHVAAANHDQIRSFNVQKLLFDNQTAGSDVHRLQLAVYDRNRIRPTPGLAFFAGISAGFCLGVLPRSTVGMGLSGIVIS